MKYLLFTTMLLALVASCSKPEKVDSHDYGQCQMDCQKMYPVSNQDKKRECVANCNAR